ncbi:hypothetical protein A8D95_13120 [Burkholderia cenocepacia]|uniref:Uncharacterized protein n=1 Tax=Burkholderia cenocepacia TaxID=95486 RepID=A0A1V2W351_9BURK|nr:hypothetical protein A8E75_18110 [Burkholderia cenocepacia]ONJ12372.1 hypothetical protein A8D83_04750 [Burkholderia cenocepacia]ONJ27533.1 hypothetical protein A8D90_13440 [Burkholderia cenocepacia]ONP19500.1 hypothetical protein A8D84_32725 [Burkholderia cenocepacia]ONP40953.1 hypothetical protein A8D87_31555 [Burkholderia cenocepacia]
MIAASCVFRRVAPSRSRRLHGSGCPAAIAPLPAGPQRASFPRHFRRHRTFSHKKYRCKKPTLQLSSYVVESGVFSHHEASFYAGFCRV